MTAFSKRFFYFFFLGCFVNTGGGNGKGPVFSCLFFLYSFSSPFEIFGGGFLGPLPFPPSGVHSILGSLYHDKEIGNVRSDLGQILLIVRKYVK